MIQTMMLILHFAALRQRRYLFNLLQTAGFRGLLQRHTLQMGDEDATEDATDDDDENPRWARLRRRQRPDPDRFPKVPSEEGRELMNSGLFGSNEVQSVSSEDRSYFRNKKKLARRVLDRELAVESYPKQKVNQRLMAQVG